MVEPKKFEFRVFTVKKVGVRNFRNFIIINENQRTIGPVNAHLISGSRFH